MEERESLQTVSKPLARQSSFIRPSALPVCRDLPLCNSLRHLGSFPGSSQLTTLLVAKLKADPELPHVAAREDVWDPLDDEGAGFLLISSSRPCSSRWPFTHTHNLSSSYFFADCHLPTRRKVRSSMGRMACGRSGLGPSGRSGLGGSSGQWNLEYEPSMFFTKLWESSRGSWSEGEKGVQTHRIHCFWI